MLRSTRNLVLMDDIVVTGVGARPFRAHVPPWCLNPRFQLVVANLVTGGSPQMKISIEHAEIGDSASLLFSEFIMNAEGVYAAYTEALTTRFPFARIRANVTELTNITSCTVSLIGLFDRQ